jgi:RNA polymerase sigma-70 factor (ECF subfamily)
MNRIETMKKPPDRTITNEISQFEEEADLAVRASHDPDVFARLYDRYFPRVYKYILYRVHDPQTADDLISKVFEKMLHGIKQFNPKRAVFGAWLFGIARHVVGDHYRFARQTNWLPLESVHQTGGGKRDAEEVVVRQEQGQLLLQGLYRLTDRERDVIGLKFAGEFNNRQIARLTGLRENHIGVILYRAIHRLRGFMNASEDLDENK